MNISGCASTPSIAQSSLITGSRIEHEVFVAHDPEALGRKHVAPALHQLAVARDVAPDLPRAAPEPPDRLERDVHVARVAHDADPDSVREALEELVDEVQIVRRLVAPDRGVRTDLQSEDALDQFGERDRIGADRLAQIVLGVREVALPFLAGQHDRDAALDRIRVEHAGRRADPEQRAEKM